MTVPEPHLLLQQLAQLQHDVAVLRDWTALLDESLHELVNSLDLFLHAENRSTTDAAPHAGAALAHRLRTIRDASGLTRAQLACITCLSDSTLRNIETNRHRPTQRTLRRLLPALIELERAPDARTSTAYPMHGVPMTSPPPAAPKPKVVYAIIERPPRKHWLRIGLAFVNQDGSLNVRIDALPLTGSLHIRDELQRIPSLDPVAAPSPDDSPELPEPGPNRRFRPARSP